MTHAPAGRRPVIWPTTALALSGALAASHALADETTGTLVAHDRKAHRIVMDDKTVYEYSPDGTEMPERLEAGMRITITYRGGEDGIEGVSRVEVAD